MTKVFNTFGLCALILWIGCTNGFLYQGVKAKQAAVDDGNPRPPLPVVRLRFNRFDFAETKDYLAEVAERICKANNGEDDDGVDYRKDIEELEETTVDWPLPVDWEATGDGNWRGKFQNADYDLSSPETPHLRVKLIVRCVAEGSFASPAIIREIEEELLRDAVATPARVHAVRIIGPDNSSDGVTFVITLAIESEDGSTCH